MSGQAKCGVKGYNGAATFLAAGGVSVYALDHIVGLFQAFLWTLGSLAFLCVGFTVGYLYIVVLRPARRQRAEVFYSGRLLPPRPAQPQFAPPQQALPQGHVTINHGHHLALPGDWSPEQIRAFRGEG